jgi:hypothetical protein
MKRILYFFTLTMPLLVIISGCPDQKERDKIANFDDAKERQEWRVAQEQIKNNNPAGLLKLWEIATESISAENSEIASEQVRGHLYSKPELWISAFSTVDFPKFKKEFESIDFDEYRFTSDGKIPEVVAAKKIVADLKKMTGKNQREQELIAYLIAYYSAILKNDNQSKQ